MAEKLNALLLSAGLGTRFRPMTDKIAKPAIRFLGIPLLGYMLYHLEQLGLKRLVFNTHHLPETIHKAVGGHVDETLYSVHYSHEPKILGSGGGILQAKELLEDSSEFIVANADEFILFDHSFGLLPLLNFHRERRALATLLTTNHPEAGRSLGGVWSDASGLITRLGGVHSETGAKHFTGVFIFSPRVFDFMPQSGGEFHIFKDCLHSAMTRGERVMAFHDPRLYWLDMSSAADFERAQASVAKIGEPYMSQLNAIKQRFGID